MANAFRSITKLMGESFKLHAHALSGYEDAVKTNGRSGSIGLSKNHIHTVAAC